MAGGGCVWSLLALNPKALPQSFCFKIFIGVGGERENTPICWFTVSRLGPKPGLPCGWQDPSDLSLPGSVSAGSWSQNWNQESDQALQGEVQL